MYDDLQAFSPTGTPITSMLEWGLGTTSVVGFQGAADGDEGRFDPTFGDGDRDDGDAVTFNGGNVYLDSAGVLWPHAALTFKTEDGEVILQGEDFPPLEDSLVSDALEVGLKARAMTAQSQGLGEADWVATVNAQGWDDQSEIVHLQGFIRDMGLMPALAAYAAAVAKEENHDEQDAQSARALRP